jgi:hypothetical protein
MAHAGIGAALLLARLAGASASNQMRPPARSEIEITFDFDAAEATLDAFSGAPAADLPAIAKLPGNVRMIAQARRFDPAATAEGFVEQLRDAAAGKKISQDTFAFNRTRDRLADTRLLLARVKANSSELAGSIRARIARFTPPALEFAVTVYFVAGGTSDGFASGDAFCVALDYFRDDDAGLQIMMAHELFHVACKAAASAAPRSGEAARLSPAAARILPLFENTMNEGIASRVGDPLAATNGKAWIEWFRGKFERNLERLDASFVLFDTILYREYHDAKAPVDQLYRIGFSGAWDSALYFVGYEMARVIEQEEGSGAVVQSLSRGSIRFFEKYIEISRAHPERVKHRFGPTTEEILRTLAAPATHGKTPRP